MSIIKRDRSDEDEEPDVEVIENACSDNHTSCINDKIDAVLEVFDEETCLGLLIGYREILNGTKLDESVTNCCIQGCEFDYSSNTYRLMVILTSGSVTIAEHFLVVKIDGATGFPKVLSVR